jgi:hypothetical protein
MLIVQGLQKTSRRVSCRHVLTQKGRLLLAENSRVTKGLHVVVSGRIFSSRFWPQTKICGNGPRPHNGGLCDQRPQTEDRNQAGSLNIDRILVKMTPHAAKVCPCEENSITEKPAKSHGPVLGPLTRPPRRPRWPPLGISLASPR